MLKKIATLLVVLTIVSMLFVPVAFAADDYVYLDVSENKTVYIDEDANGVPFKVYAVKADGTKDDVSDSINYPYTVGNDGTQDNTVFYISSKKLYSTGRNGKVAVSLSYKTPAGTTLSKRIMFFRQSSTTQTASTVTPQPIAVDGNNFLTNATNSAYITNGTPGTAEGGHFDGSAFSNWPNNYTVCMSYKSYVPSTPSTNIKYKIGRAHV